MVQETKANKTEEWQDDIIANIMADQDFNQKFVQAANTITLKPLAETSLLVVNTSFEIVRINVFTQIEQSSLCIVAHDSIDVLLRRNVYVTVINALISVIKWAKHLRVVTTGPFLS